MKTKLFEIDGEPTDFLYQKAMQMADTVLSCSNLGLTWDELPDTNSIWDYLYNIRNESDLFYQIQLAVLDRWYESEYGTKKERIHFGKVIECLTLQNLKIKEWYKK